MQSLEDTKHHQPPHKRRKSDEGESFDSKLREKETNSEHNNNNKSSTAIYFEFGYKTERGGREENQDSFIVPNYSGLIGDKDHLPPLFAVLDGHGTGGKTASGEASRLLYKTILSTVQANPDANIKEVISKAVNKAHAELTEISKQKDTEFGTTLVIGYIDPKEPTHLYIGNVGDSRGILVRRRRDDTFKTALKTIEHKPNEPTGEERTRVEENEGHVKKKNGTWRVYPGDDAKREKRVGLAMTRAIGHEVLSQYGVTPDVDYFELKGEDGIRSGDVLVLASDGVWDTIDNKDICEMAEDNCNEDGILDNPQKFANKIVEEAAKRWDKNKQSSDNITTVVVSFREESLHKKHHHAADVQK